MQEFARVLDIEQNTHQWHELVRAQSWMEDIPINKIEEYSNQVINSSEFFKGLKQSATWNYSNLLCFISAVWQKVEKEIGSPRVQEFAKALKIKPGTPQWEYLLSNERENRNFNRIPIDRIQDYTEQFIKLHKKELLGIDEIEKELSEAAKVEKEESNTKEDVQNSEEVKTSEASNTEEATKNPEGMKISNEKESSTKEDVRNSGEAETSSENVSAANVQKKGLPPQISDWEKKDIDNLVDAIIKEVTDTCDLGVISTFKLKEFANVLNIAPNAKWWDDLIHETRTMFSDFQINELKEYANQVLDSNIEYKKRKQNGNWDDYHCLMDFISAVRQKIKKEIGTPKVQEFAKALKIKPGTPQWDELLNYEYCMHDISIDKIQMHTNWYIKSTPKYKNYNWDKGDVENIVTSVTNRILNYDIVGDDPRLEKFAKVLDIKPNTPQWDALVKTQNFMEDIPVDKIEKYSNQVINSNEEFEEYKQSGKWGSPVLAAFICDVKEKMEKEIGSPIVQEFTKVLKIKPGTPQLEYLLSNERETGNFYKIPICMIKDYTEQFIKLHKKELLGIDEIEKELSEAANVQKKGLPSKISDWKEEDISNLVHDIADEFRDHGFGYIPYFRLQEFANILNIKEKSYQWNTLVRISSSCDLLDNTLNKLSEYTEQIINSNEEYKKQKQSGNWDYRPLESFLMNLYRKITPERYSSPKLKEFAKVLKIKPGTLQWNALRKCEKKCDDFEYIPIYEIETYVNYYIKSNPEYENKNYNWEVLDVAYIVMEVDNMIKSGFAIDDSNESRLNKFAKILNIKSNIWCDLLETQEFMEDVPIDKIEEYANQVLDSNIEYKKRKEKGNWDNKSLRSFMKDCREMVRKEIGSPRVQAFAKLLEIEPGTHEWEYLLESERETDCFDKIPIEEINEDYMKQFVKSYKKKLLGIDEIEEELGEAANVEKEESNTKEDVQNSEEVKTSSENVNADPVQKKGFPPKISDWTKEDVYKLLDNIINEVMYENSTISFFKLKEFADELGIKPNDKPWNFLVEYYHTFSMFREFKVDELKECARLMINSRKKYERLKLSGNWDDESLGSFIMALDNKIYTENGSPKVQKFAEALKIQRDSSSSQWKVLLQAEKEHHNDFRKIPINRIKKHTEWYIKSTPGYKNKNYNWNDSDIFNIISNVCNRIINNVGIGDDPKLQKFAEVLEIHKNTSQWNALVATQSCMQYIPIDKIEEYSNQVINSNVEFEKYKQSGIWDSQVLAEFIYEVKKEIKEEKKED